MKVSVVVPAYNAERYLEECLRSVKAQSFRPYELLLVNDGSTDSTVDIAKKYVDRVINRELNHGIGHARFLGSTLASGDFVAFLSADDAYHPYFLEMMMRKAERDAAMFSDYWFCDSQLRRQKVFTAPQFNSQEEFRKLAVQWALKRNLFVNFSTVIIPRSIFETVSFNENLRYGEDLAFLLESLIAGLPWKHVAFPLVHYRLHKDAGTVKRWNTQTVKQLWEQITPLLLSLGVDGNIIKRSMKLERRRRKFPAPLKRVIRKVLKFMDVKVERA